MIEGSCLVGALEYKQKREPGAKSSLPFVWDQFREPSCVCRIEQLHVMSFAMQKSPLGQCKTSLQVLH